MPHIRKIFSLLFIVLACHTQAQQRDVLQKADSLISKPDSAVVLQVDTLKKTAADMVPQTGKAIPGKTTVKEVLKIEEKSFKPNPSKAVIYAAIFPGLGQIYNRKYWKLPILYGGFVGVSYAITWNNGYYQDYSKAYTALMGGSTEQGEIDKWSPFLRPNQTPEDILKNKDSFASELKRRKDFYRYYRDLSIIIAVGIYGLSIVDAYVDAQLFDFDISPDLSMRVEPTVIRLNNSDFLAQSLGFKCSFSF